MAFHAVFSKMQNRKYPFQFQRINASSPLWLDRTAVYLIKGPDSVGLKSMFYFVIPSRLILLMFARMNIDLLSASGHKIHGPKGIGVLYVRKGVKISSFIHGGAQERKRRAGTHNVPGIVGMGKAASLAEERMEQSMARERELRDYTIGRIEKEIPYCRLNGDRVDRLPNNINFCFRYVEGESLLIMLDSKGICASSGSACTSGSLDPSHVLLAIGLPHEIAHGSLRMTISESTTKEELDETVDHLKAIIERLRSMSPLYEDFIKSQKA